MARVGLKWTTDDLARNARVDRMTVARFERGDTVVETSVTKMRDVLTTAGGHFTQKAGKVGVAVPE
ncbi:hypothetical protein ASE06_07520 [Sphingopyxis sp. Root214]|nr:hypothetical protein ASD73_00475 [Sphingopyxis sp. Root154]KRC09670.1 hypothetical protein ASE06_07520 [Sphingopyxis sp. Root214]